VRFHRRVITGWALLLGFALMSGCSNTASAGEEMPASEPDPAYNDVVARYIKETFKDHATYQAYEISTFRWVHSLKGWAWITCVRFQDQGHPRTYAVFVQESKVVDSRYAVQTDACNAQAYGPFSTMGAMRPGVLGPLY
jgi:hypothetical protein